MPLSEDEQRILSEIEANLRASDPDLARQVSSTTVYTDSLRQLKWWVVAFVAALVASVLLLSVNYLLAFVGFLGMVAAAVFIERNVRKVGKVGMSDASEAFKGSGFRSYLHDAGERARERMRRDEDES